MSVHCISDPFIWSTEVRAHADALALFDQETVFAVDVTVGLVPSAWTVKPISAAVEVLVGSSS